jgi:hypothetical protein
VQAVANADVATGGKRLLFPACLFGVSTVFRAWQRDFLSFHLRNDGLRVVRIVDSFHSAAERIYFCGQSRHIRFMHYLYALKRDRPKRLVATFDSDEQLRSYVRWATLQEFGSNRGKFEQGSSLAGSDGWESSTDPPHSVDPESVVHNPSPSML